MIATKVQQPTCDLVIAEYTSCDHSQWLNEHKCWYKNKHLTSIAMLSCLVITPRKKHVCFIPTRHLLQFPPSWLHIKVRKSVVFALNKSILYIIFLSQLPETCHVLISNLLTRYSRIILRRSSCSMIKYFLR